MELEDLDRFIHRMDPGQRAVIEAKFEEMAALERAMAEIAAGVGDLLERVTEHPMTVWRPWDAPECSQLRAARDVAKTRKLAILGGNRSGKTELALRLFLALVLGADHPDVALWAETVGIDITDWPKGPGVGYCVALTNEASRQYHRNRFVPGDLLGNYAIKWWGFDSTSPAKLSIWVPGYKDPAVIWFRSQDQGKAAFQGASVRTILMDEEGDEEALMQEAGIRLVDQNGWLFVSATPYLKGTTWFTKRFAPGGKAERTGWIVHRLKPRHNPGIDFDRMLAEVAGDPVAASIRLDGAPCTDRDVLVYPQWTPDVHVYDEATGRTASGTELPPPADDAWRFRGHDFGYRDPTVILWAYLARDGVVVIYDEYYEPGRTTAEHCDACLERDPPAGPWDAWGDASARQEERDWGERGIRWTAAERNIPGGTKRVGDMLTQGRILVSSKCENLIREMGTLERDPTKDAPKPNTSDHATDVLRYIISGMVDAGYIRIDMSPQT